ncbi:hypothetical protein OAK57_01285 [Synechococcus sp. AH-551-N23]|nr:hypothetical protein [Synechococcus sp. AH-551-N23]
MATLTTGIADLLLLASGFAGLDRSLAVIVANDYGGCSPSWQESLFCIGMAQS